MKSIGLALCLLAVLSHSASISAYEIDTHEKLSIDAYAASNLQQDPDVQGNLGLNTSDKFPGSDGIPKSIIQLIGDGAKFEDTLTAGRPSNHFYNPLTGAPLTVLGLALGSPSPDWALEDKGQINGVLGKQDFSYQDARQYFYDALTQADKTKREENFGKTFQTMGHIIHHVQDMAQPEHVRNDQHLELGTGGTIGLCMVSPALCAGYFAIKNPSLYESYTNRPDVRAKLPIDFSVLGYDVNDPKFSGTFNSPRKLWHSNDGKGMADFTNRGFVSAGTIFDSAFPAPVLDLSKKLDFDIKDLVPGTSLKGNVRFYGNTVTDNYTGASVNNPMAVTRSIFDAELEKYATFGKRAVYTLNRFNFDVAHSFLIPRSVGYSAGLINYFFRGKLDFIEDTNNAGKYVIKNFGPEDMTGTFTLYYDAVDGKRYPVAGDTPSTTWAARTISSKGQLDNLTFTPPTSPAPSIPGEYMLVFNGDMGEEKAVPGVTVGAIAVKKSGGAGFYAAIADQSSLYFRPGYIHVYSKTGDPQKKYLSGLPSAWTWSVAVNAGRRYTVGSSATDPYNANGGFHAYIDGTTEFGNFNFAGAIAANSKGVYVYEFDPIPDPGGFLPLHDGEIKRYTLEGVFLGSFPTTGFPGESYTLSANEKGLCTVNGLTRNDSVFTGLFYDLTGNLIVSVPLTGSWTCALTQDRLYFADWNGSAVVGVYDLAGNKLDSLPIGPDLGIYSLAVTEQQLYVGTISRGTGSILIFDRSVQRDLSGNITSDKYTYRTSISLGREILPMGLAVDAATVR